MSGLKQFKKNDLLFREGDESDAMYVIKSGKIAITKSKGASEIVLAELGPGDMLGEMAFFDNRPRSAGARAASDCVVIELPFKALNAQFKTFPEWLKAIVRTVNNHLRSANIKIKNLEKSSEEDTEYFSPYMVTRLMATLGLIATRFGDRTEDGILVPAGTLRRYTIQIYQLPTNKMQKLMELLESQQVMKVEDLGEGRTKIMLYKLDLVMGFVDYYNEWLFKSEDKRITLSDKEMKPIKALLHFGRKETPSANGDVKVNLTQIQADANKEIGWPFSTDEIASLAEKKLTSEPLSTDNGLAATFNLAELELTAQYWDLIHLFKKVQRG